MYSGSKLLTQKNSHFHFSSVLHRYDSSVSKVVERWKDADFRLGSEWDRIYETSEGKYKTKVIWWIDDKKTLSLKSLIGLCTPTSHFVLQTLDYAF